uniref:Caspase-8-like n=1 Tax=Sinocyclocheilus grahami TaxID=75366 RepID=A0A672RF70_SINGR
MLTCPLLGFRQLDRGQHGHPDWSAAMQPHTQQTVIINFLSSLSYNSLSVGSDHTGQPLLPTCINPVASSPVTCTKSLLLHNTPLSICVCTERLEVVFKWLGFEVLVEQDCNRHQILQVLRNLAARDHTPADCAVCCVLSHGRVEGICGVDGEIVTFRELIETLSPNECPSLCKKPKLFFIQACRGNNNQPAAFPQTCSEDEDMLFSDAAVPRDSIPEMADYLLAMSTVPHYVSYREKSRGTWFIQSLSLLSNALSSLAVLERLHPVCLDAIIHYKLLLPIKFYKPQ